MIQPIADQERAQGEYHRNLFHAVHDWDRLWGSAVEISGSGSAAHDLGLDQMGHFGPQGCDLVIAEIVRHLTPGARIDIAELGCGFGGALRYVVDRLGERGVEVVRGVGLDIVGDHLRVFGAASAASPGVPAAPVCADVHALPLGDSSLDVVYCTGSMPHFANGGQVLAEAARVLRPGGLLVVTEETSLNQPGLPVSAAFRLRHPRDIFFFASPEERLDQLRAAGFTAIALTDLTAWAGALLQDRLKTMRLFFGDVAAVYGEEETVALIDTLGVARDEYVRGAIMPAIITARRPGGGQAGARHRSVAVQDAKLITPESAA